VQLASEDTIKRLCFQNCLGTSKFPDYLSNTVKMHQLATLVSKFNQQFQLQNIVSNSVRRQRLATLL